MGKGYWIACVNVKNKKEFKKYIDLAGPAVDLHNGDFIVRGVKVFNIEGKKYERVVVSVFDSLEKQKNVMNQKNIKKH